MKLRLSNLTVVYDEGTPLEVTALRNFSLEIQSGVPLVVWGANGSGKTSLLRVLAGDLLPTSGEIELNTGATAWIPVHQAWLISESEYIRQQPIAGLFPD